MKPCLSETLTLPASFADDVATFSEVGCHAIEVWLPKLETHLESHSLSDTRNLLGEWSVTLVAAAYQGGLLLSQGEQRAAHYDHFRKRLELCRQLSIPTLLVVADFGENLDQAALKRSVVSLKQAAQWAAGFDVRLALEFRSKNAFCSSLDTALSLIEQCDEPNVGVNFDVFHYYTGPSKFDDLDLLTADRLAHVQLSDLAGMPRELATDSDRVLPGDGDFRLQPLLERFRSMGYAGWISVELMNPTFWNTKPAQVADVAWTAIRRVLNG